MSHHDQLFSVHPGCAGCVYVAEGVDWLNRLYVWRGILVNHHDLCISTRFHNKPKFKF